MTRFLPILLTAFTNPAVAWADNWPAWRGPTGQGVCSEKNVPLTWGPTTNVKWKVPLADPGNSTPVVWNDAVFLTQANKGGSVRSLYCFNRADGKIRWRKDVAYDAKERNWNPSWYCNASPATDGERVVVSFGSAGVYCYDFAGREVWKRTDLGTWEHAYGNGASPVLYGDLAVQWCGPNEPGKGKNVLLAVDKKTGRTVWERDERNGSWATPVVARVHGHDQLLLGSGPRLRGYDPASGRELWFCDGLQDFVYASALYDNGVAVGMSGYGKSSLAVKLGGTGDIGKDRLWLHPKPANQRVGSGVLHEGHLYVVDENGQPRCYEVATGKNLWESADKLNAVTWGSIVLAEGRLYTLMRNSETVVLAAKPKFEVLAVNPLEKGENTNSSPAVSDGEIFIRTFKHLWCIAAKK